MVDLQEDFRQNMKKVTLSKVKVKAWKQFSLWIRLSAAKDGRVLCYTCPAVVPYTEANAGHWIEGHSNAVYINPDYVRVQCRSCNIFHGGRQGIFRDKIRQELGDKRVDQLILASNQVKLLTIEDYQNLEKLYKDKLQSLIPNI